MSFSDATRCINTPVCFECRGNFVVVLVFDARVPVLNQAGVTVDGNRLLLFSATLTKTPFKAHLSVSVAGGTRFVLDTSDIVSVSDLHGNEIYA